MGEWYYKYLQFKKNEIRTHMFQFYTLISPQINNVLIFMKEMEENEQTKLQRKKKEREKE